jgi:hypothetical protein
MKQTISRWFIAVIAGVLVTTAVIPEADARPRPSRKRNFSANKTFGLGLMLGAPTGLSGKYFIGQDTAIDFGVGVIRYYRHRRSNLHIHADFLWHPVSLASTEPFELPLYFGVGARVWDFDDDDDRAGFGLGVRVPIGIAFDFNNVPLDVFIELALVVDLFFDYDDDYAGDVNGAVGVRYYFN